MASMEIPQNLNKEFGSIFNYLNRLDESREIVIKLIPFADDVQLEETKQMGDALGKTGWVIVAACNSEIKKRAERLLGGRGKKDFEGIGSGAAEAERARQIGKSSSQVRRDAQIFETFETTLTDQQSLLKEKGFFEQALRTPDPKKTLRVFEKEKSNNPNFSVGDAKRLARELREQKPPIVVPDQPDYIPPNLKNFLLELEASLQSFSNRCPRPEFKIRIDGWLRATRFERGRTPQKDYESVRDQIDKLCATPDEIAEEVYLSLDEVKDLCEQIITRESNAYEKRPIGANTDVARGPRTMGYFRKDSPHYESKAAPRSNYEPTVDWEDDL